ncbi:MAG: hypothetical protein ACOX1P_32655 [Thermoguttaceae bacterium]|jgi:hypothetical protein
MPLFNPCDDFPSVADGLEPVTLIRPGSELAIELAALRGAVSRREAAASAGRYTAADVAWHLPGRTFTPEPRVGDLLMDGGGRRWTILSVTRATCGARWRCICRNLAVEQGLDDYIDLERAVATKSAAGAEVLAWRPWRTGLACRVQPVAAQLGAEGQAGRDRWRIYLLDEVELDGVCRARAPGGTVYRILASRRPERLGELMYLDVERQ